MNEIRRVGVFSLAKVVGLLYGVFGLVIWLLMGCFFLIGVAASDTSNDASALLPVFCLLPLLYAAIGFVSGGIIGLIYNAVASRLGGIEVELVSTREPGIDTGTG